MDNVTETRKAELISIGQAIAADLPGEKPALGNEWKVTYELLYSWKPVVRLSREDGATLSLFFRPDEKVEVSGEYPRDYSSYAQRAKAISIAVVRGPRAIARGIESRFLSHYLTAYAQAVESVRRAHEGETARMAALEQLAAVIGEPVHPNGTLYVDIPWVDATQDWSHLYVTLSSKSSGNFKVDNVPTVVLTRLLQVMQDYRKGNPNQSGKGT